MFWRVTNACVFGILFLWRYAQIEDVNTRQTILFLFILIGLFYKPRGWTRND